jgi:hypothetical protein
VIDMRRYARFDAPLFGSVGKEMNLSAEIVFEIKDRSSVIEARS